MKAKQLPLPWAQLPPATMATLPPVFEWYTWVHDIEHKKTVRSAAFVAAFVAVVQEAKDRFKGKHGTTPNQLYLPGPGRILGAQYTLPKDDGTFGSLSGLAVLEDGRLGFTEFALAKW